MKVNVDGTHLKKVQVAVPLDAGDLQVSHHHLTVLVELAQSVVVLIQIGQGAELVVSALTHCKTERKCRKCVKQDQKHV